MTKWLQNRLALLCAVCLLCALTSGYAAVDRDVAMEDEVTYDKLYVYVDGALEYTGYNINGTAYVPLRSFCRALDMGAVVTWNGANNVFYARLKQTNVFETVVEHTSAVETAEAEELPDEEVAVSEDESDGTAEQLTEEVIAEPTQDMATSEENSTDCTTEVAESTPDVTPEVVREVTHEYHTILAGVGDIYITVDDRAIYLGTEIINYRGNILVPLDGLSRAFNITAVYDETLGGLNLDTQNLQVCAPGNSVYNEEDLYWLSRIVHAEAGNQSMEGRICVGNVVLNRVKSEKFPNSIKDVVLSPGQFCPVTSGSIYCTPTPESIAAAKLCLEGVNMAGESTYFVNPVTGVTGWFRNNLTFYKSVGDHDFYY